VQGERIDRAPAILDDDVVDQLDVAELRVDRHVGGVRAVCICVLAVEERAFGGDAVARHGRHVQRRAVRPDRRPAVDDLYLLRFARKPRGRRGPDRGAQVFRRGKHGRAAHHHRA
jgi:hypothetical protein